MMTKKKFNSEIRRVVGDDGLRIYAARTRLPRASSRRATPPAPTTVKCPSCGADVVIPERKETT